MAGEQTPAARRVRRARSYDLNAVLDLYTGCGLVPPERGFRRELERKLISDPDLFLVALDADGDIVGAVTAGYDGRLVTVSRLATDPDHRRCGVATALIAELHAALEQLGARAPDIVVIDDTVDSQRFFSAAGYDRTHRVPVYRPGTNSGAEN